MGTPLSARRPKLLYLAGRDARLAGMLARIPARPRARILARAMGLLPPPPMITKSCTPKTGAKVLAIMGGLGLGVAAAEHGGG